MKLKSLELIGFKSFGENAHLDFTQGFTAIVGPNGCGKSNISDAIRWVIGEQNSRALRGQKLTDLIFNGSASRKALNRAEISLVLEEIPMGLRVANVPLAGTEVKVTRCYHRSGDSEYFINQIPCRLKDIIDLFLDLGISSRSMTIVEQNHVQEIISAKPEQRRYLIEEAAGILKFKHRKHEAELKLNASRQNLLRITDIVQELSRQTDSLKRQADKAERYKRYRSELKNFSLNLFSQKIREFQKELEKLEKELVVVEDKKAQLTSSSSTIENRIEELKEEISELQIQIDHKKDAVRSLANQISKDEHSIELKQTQVEAAKKDSNSAESEVSEMKKEIQELESGTVSQRSELGKVSEEIGLQESTCDELAGKTEQKREALQEEESLLRSKENRSREVYAQLAQKNNACSVLDTRIENIEGRAEKLKRERQEALEEKEKTEELAKSSEVLFEEKCEALETLKSSEEEVKEKIQDCKSQLKIREEEYEVVREEYYSRNSYFDSLKALRQKFEGFDEGVKVLMSNTNGDRLPGLLEVMVDVLKAPEEVEPALEAVLGNRLQSVIVDSYNDSLQAINYLKTNESGRGSFIPKVPRSFAKPPIVLNGNPAVRGKLKDMVQCPSEYASIVDHLLGDVVLVEDLETALGLYTKPDFQGVVVTQAGEIFDSQGVVSGGNVKSSSAGLLSQKREIEELEAEIETLRSKMELAKEAKETVGESLAELERQLSEIRPQLYDTEVEKEGRRKDLEQVKRELERLDRKLSALDYEHSSGEVELGELTKERDSMKLALSELESEKGQIEGEVEKAKSNLEEIRADLEKNSSDLNAQKVLIASLKGKRDIILSDIKRLIAQKENYETRVEKREKDTKDNIEVIVKFREEIDEIEKGIVVKAREKDESSEALVEVEEVFREKENNLDDSERESKSLFKEFQENAEILSQRELRRSEIKIQSAHFQEQAFNDFNVTLEEILENYNEKVDDEAEIEEHLRELRRKIERMGEVNLAALSEYEQANERYTFLFRQQQDLTESMETLSQAIDKINQTTLERFTDTFEKVNEQFSQIYARLFQGGKARLNLCDAENPLESGVEIFAQPLGKKMQNLSLLSGGEKAMTALSLIFALLKIRPTPFCFLDEVDAPLDEPNVVRFQTMLQELTGKTQFILITHNQRTMSFANILYGVTMEERGVSKIVSVNLN
jgi:chromosome segregation protein